jgi:hypothetical protein
MEQVKHFLAHKKFRPHVVKQRNSLKRPHEQSIQALEEDQPARVHTDPDIEESVEDSGSMQSHQSATFIEVPEASDTDIPSKRQRLEHSFSDGVADEIEAAVAGLVSKIADDKEEMKRWIYQMRNEESNPPSIESLMKSWFLRRHLLNAEDQRIIRRYAELVPDFHFEG